MILIMLLVLSFAAYVAIRNPNRRDAEVDDAIRRHEKIRRLKATAGVAPSFEDIAMSRAKSRMD